MKDLFNENYKPLKTKIEDISRWKDLPCPWISKSNIVKMALYQKQSTCSMQYPSKFHDILHRNRKGNHEVYMETQMT
jgi:hypothetical protein